ncbi:hypothetical protein EVAR_2351_1 [Eumeta japonica]|uniref:Uncharacterized protein n=1 Tax=Eumeta variegata TaxID=151549 RepID=A0A4C1SI93_EUMVA|nr:hypothetical protein EVAR_2351_1 [Eumeta japonica]
MPQLKSPHYRFLYIQLVPSAATVRRGVGRGPLRNDSLTLWLVCLKSNVCSGCSQRLIMKGHLEPISFDGLENLVMDAQAERHARRLILAVTPVISSVFVK